MAEQLMCRTFSDDGRDVVCDRPATHIVWGHLYERRDKGPKCTKHLPKKVREQGMVHLTGLGIFTEAIYVIPDAVLEPRVQEVIDDLSCVDEKSIATVVAARTVATLRGEDSDAAVEAAHADLGDQPPRVSPPGVVVAPEQTPGALRDAVWLAVAGKCISDAAAHGATDAVLAAVAPHVGMVRRGCWADGWRAATAGAPLDANPYQWAYDWPSCSVCGKPSASRNLLDGVCLSCESDARSLLARLAAARAALVDAPETYRCDWAGCSGEHPSPDSYCSLQRRARAGADVPETEARTVTTAEELDALPHGTHLRGRDGQAYLIVDAGIYAAGSGVRLTPLIVEATGLPARVLYVPTEETR